MIFNLVLLPTRFMMMKSSLKMMRIQPKVEAIKKRYAHLKMNDPKRAEMNAEMMELYKTEGVNMYGGCLPMLLQMPLFFAYYRVLLNAVELRQAHWFWLTDLSAPDPLHILPILIIISMFLVQYITPSPGMDPTQRRMMAIMMPVIFGFMLWHYASGLALYWGTGNIINLAIQIGINQSSMGKEMHAIAARRAAKEERWQRAAASFRAAGKLFRSQRGLWIGRIEKSSFRPSAAASASLTVGCVNWKPADSSLAGNDAGAGQQSFIGHLPKASRKANAGTGKECRAPKLPGERRVNSAFVTGFGEVKFTGPASEGVSSAKRIATIASARLIQLIH